MGRPSCSFFQVVSLIAAADGPVPAADPVASFDHGDRKPGSFQFAGRDQAGDSGPKDQHRTAFAQVVGRRGEVLGDG